MDTHTVRKLEFDKVLVRIRAYTETSLGSGRVDSLYPEQDIPEIERAQEEAAQGRRLLEMIGPLPLGGIRDVEPYLGRAVKGLILAPEELLEISMTLYGSRRVQAYFQKMHKEGLDMWALTPYEKQITPLEDLEKAINGILDDQGQVRDDASTKLQSIRREKQTLSQRVRERLEGYLSSRRTEKMIQEAVVTIRGDRYVIPIKSEYRASFPGILHDRSSSGQTLFIEPQAVVEMNNRLRSLERDEEEEIYRLLSMLTQEVALKADALQNTLEALGTLDLIMAKARFSREWDCCKPVLNEGGPIRLKEARHPLIASEEVVPIDVALGDSFRTLVITGPNTGGKTVSLKTVGLMCLMAQAGIPIPALEGSQVGVYKGIYADIGDEQSIEQSLSTFSSHLTQIVRILQEVEKGDLILLDEVGAGTDPEEGAALAMALLEHLHNREVHTVATTHYTELKAFAYSTPGLENAAVEFDVDTLSPTYRLLMGVPGRSNAFAIARRLGLDEDIIVKARNFTAQDEDSIEGMINRIEKEEYALLQEREDVRREKDSVEKLEEELKRIRQEEAQKQKKLLEDTYQKAQSLLRSIREEGQKMLKEIRHYAGPEGDRMANNFNRVLKEKEAALKEFASQDQNLEAGPPPETLKRGDTVHILNLREKGQVLKVDGDRLCLQVGVMQIWSSRQEVRLLEEEATTVRGGKKVAGLKGAKTQSVRSSLDLRGKRWEEARDETDKYLDDAYLAGLKQVTIIHGKGTGALRGVVHELLSSHPHVQDFRLGERGEGGHGATIAVLRV